MLLRLYHQLWQTAVPCRYSRNLHTPRSSASPASSGRQLCRVGTPGICILLGLSHQVWETAVQCRYSTNAYIYSLGRSHQLWQTAVPCQYSRNTYIYSSAAPTNSGRELCHVGTLVTLIYTLRPLPQALADSCAMPVYQERILLGLSHQLWQTAVPCWYSSNAYVYSLASPTSSGRQPCRVGTPGMRIQIYSLAAPHHLPSQSIRLLNHNIFFPLLLPASFFFWYLV